VRCGLPPMGQKARKTSSAARSLANDVRGRSSQGVRPPHRLIPSDRRHEFDEELWPSRPRNSAFAFAMGTDRCAYEYCARHGPPYHVFGMLFYGAPLVAVLAVIASFWTARRSWCILIPLAALAFFGIDLVVLYLTFEP
jgi:hypothetical protein